MALSPMNYYGLHSDRNSENPLLGQQLALIQQYFVCLSSEILSLDDWFHETLPPVDFFVEVLEHSQRASLEILNHPKEMLQRDHVFLPPNRVKEMDSRCIRWLCRQPDTRDTKKMLAVIRRGSLDTGENRLFLQFMKEVLSLCGWYQQHIPPDQAHDLVFSMERTYVMALRREDFQEIKPWKMNPPNNTLLSHVWYSVIWKQWQILTHLEEEYQSLQNHLDESLLTVFLGILLSHLQQNQRCPQMPLCFSREQGKFQKEFLAVFHNGIEEFLLTLQQTETQIHILGKKSDGSSFSFGCEMKDGVLFSLEEKKFLSFSENPEKTYLQTLEDSVEECFAPLIQGNTSVKIQKKIKKTEQTSSFPQESFRLVDFFSLYPLCQTETSPEHSPRPFLVQSHENILCSCVDSKGILLSESESIESMTFYRSCSPCPPEMSRKQWENRTDYLTRTFCEGHPAKSLCFLVPDGINEFQLSPLRKQLKQSYRQLESLPYSFSVATDYILKQSKEVLLPISEGKQGVISVDLKGNTLSFTLLKGTMSPLGSPPFGSLPCEESLLADYLEKEIFWERHPTYSVTIEHLNENLNKNWNQLENIIPKQLLELCSLEDLLKIPEDFPFILEKTEEHTLFYLTSQVKDSIKNLVYSLEKELTSVLDSIFSNVGNQEMEGFLLFTSLSFLRCPSKIKDIPISFHYVTPQQRLEGGHQFYLLQQKAQEILDISLWKDKLPELYIRMGAEKIPLITEKEIYPVLGKAVDIPIQKRMTLTAGVEKYSFKVEKEDSDQPYLAVISHPRFPLEENLTCSLHLTYEYGALEPYVLKLTSLGTGGSGSFSMKVEWTLQEEEDWENLAYPPFPLEVTQSVLEKPFSRRCLDATLTQSIWEVVSSHWAVLPREILTKKQVKQSDFILEEDDTLVVFEKYQLCDSRMGSGISDKAPLSFQTSGEKQFTQKLSPVGWYQNRGGYCLEISSYEMSPELRQKRIHSLSFHSDRFLREEDFSAIRKSRTSTEVSFRLREKEDGRCFVESILLTGEKSREDAFFVEPLERAMKAELYALRRLNWGGSVISSCPEEVKERIKENLSDLLEAYGESTNLYPEETMLILSLYPNLLDENRQTQLYDLAQKKLENMKKKKSVGYKFYQLGCLLGDVSSLPQKALLETLLTLPPHHGVALLSRAIWGHSGFVAEEREEILLEYFSVAVDLLLGERKKIPVVTAMYLEFILGVFRLRQFGNPATCRTLSLGNPKMKQLKDWVQKKIEEEFDLFTHIKIKIHNPPSHIQKKHSFLELFQYFLLGDTQGLEISISSEE